MSTDNNSQPKRRESHNKVFDSSSLVYTYDYASILRNNIDQDPTLLESFAPIRPIGASNESLDQKPETGYRFTLCAPTETNDDPNRNIHDNQGEGPPKDEIDLESRASLVSPPSKTSADWEKVKFSGFKGYMTPKEGELMTKTFPDFTPIRQDGAGTPGFLGTPTSDIWRRESTPGATLKEILESFIKEDRSVDSVERLLEYLNVNLENFVKKRLPRYEAEMPIEPITSNRLLKFKIRDPEGFLVGFSIIEKDKEHLTFGESPFIIFCSNSRRTSRADTIEQGRIGKSRENSADNSYRYRGQFEIRGDASPRGLDPLDISNKLTNMDDSKRYLFYQNNLEAPFLNSESVDNLLVPDERLNKIFKHINNFIRELPKEKDWTELRTILRGKFMDFEYVTPKTVRRFLRKFKKIVHPLDEVCANIMAKKIDINFFELPMYETAKEIATSETSIVNFVRDIAWAPLTFLTIDIFRNKADSDFFSAAGTQMVVSMVAMAIVAVLYHLIKKRFGSKDDEDENEPVGVLFIRSLFTWLGAGLAVPGWNILQQVGVNIGMTNLNLSLNSSGYFSSLFPGIAEGPIQGILSIISANTLNGTWKKFRLYTFGKQVLIFATFGAVPGNIWQVAYQVITGPIDALGNISTPVIVVILGLGLASAVYIGNVAFGTGYERIINKSHLILEFEAIEGNIDLDPIIDEENDHVVSYNGRPGAPNRRSIVLLSRDHSHSGDPHDYSHGNSRKHSRVFSRKHSRAFSHKRSNATNA